jgi:tRNA threonylcarbamoyladenosine biosynthesis protein TsaB
MIPAVALAIETSTSNGSVALFREGKEPVLAELGVGSAHGRELAPAIKGLLDAVGLKPAALELVICGLGPGSYTGLRVGAATAIGISLGTGCPLIGVSSLAAVAAAAGKEGDVLFTTADAGRGNCYFAAFRLSRGLVQVETAHAVGTWQQAASLVEAGWLLAGEGARRIAAQDGASLAAGEDGASLAAGEDGASLAAGEDGASLAPGGTRSAISVGRLGLATFSRLGPTAPGDLRPLYLRKSSAEINWEANRKRDG